MKNKIGVDTILIIVAIVIVGIFLIIALSGRRDGVRKENNGGQTLSGAIKQATSKELQNFNAKIIGYAGNQKGMILKALIAAVNTSNSENERQIALEGGENIDENASYNVSMEYDSAGYINKVIIKETN